jgi:predicted glycogen debranching enzyme
MANTRRYHGLLVAALRPPLGRTVLVSKLEATARIGVDLFPLTTNEYVDGTLNPHGYHSLESFALEGTTPVFTWAIADCQLEQRIWMDYGHNTTHVTYTLVRAARPIAIEIIPLCTYRDANARTDARRWTLNVRSVPGGLRVDAESGAVPYWIQANTGTFVSGVVRHWALRHRRDSYRGMSDSEDLFAIGRLDTKLCEGETLAVVLTTEQVVESDWEAAHKAEADRQAALVSQSGLADEPEWIRQLVLAADQFIVERSVPTTEETEKGKTILAGYPWLGDTGRDTMIALPGLTLATGRSEIGASILRTFARFVDQGMLPNHFPEGHDQQGPEYGTADAALWLFHAAYLYLERTQDLSLIEELYPTLVDIIEWYLKGTRFGLHVDDDGLVQIGEAPIGLTWMNAQDGDRIVTPRVGKPVELNALWHNALATMSRFATELENEAHVTRWENLAEKVSVNFENRFWYEDGDYLYDVVDGPTGDDVTLRPNQILAVSLPFQPLVNHEKARAVVDTVARHLYTSYGLRTLSLHDSAFAPRYGGNQASRAAAFHQGTVWAWLSGPFAAAHLKVYKDVEKARSFVRPFADQLSNHGLGTISEIFDASPPYTPRGCIASAWSVSQVLCSWLACSNWSSANN